MSDFINTTDILGDEAVCNAYIDGTITELRDNRITKVADYAFRNRRNLVLLDLPNVTSIGTYGCFYSLLTTLILRGDTVCTLGSNALASTPISKSTGYIYVPSALLATYQSATNWSTYSARFRALEDYTVDGTTTGELDSTKI